MKECFKLRDMKEFINRSYLRDVVYKEGIERMQTETFDEAIGFRELDEKNEYYGFIEGLSISHSHSYSAKGEESKIQPHVFYIKNDEIWARLPDHITDSNTIKEDDLAGNGVEEIITIEDAVKKYGNKVAFRLMNLSLDKIKEMRFKEVSSTKLIFFGYDYNVVAVSTEKMWRNPKDKLSLDVIMELSYNDMLEINNAIKQKNWHEKLGDKPHWWVDSFIGNNERYKIINKELKENYNSEERIALNKRKIDYIGDLRALICVIVPKKDRLKYHQTKNIGKSEFKFYYWWYIGKYIRKLIDSIFILLLERKDNDK